MSKRFWSILIAGALISSVFSVGSATAQTPTEIPATANIEDPIGDGNFINDQGAGATIGFQGDTTGGASIGAGDVHKVWFTNTASDLSVHILTTFPPPNSRFGVIYRVAVNEGCATFTGIVPSITYVGAQEAFIPVPPASCGEGFEQVVGEVSIQALDDGSERGITTLTYPLGSRPDLALGLTLAGPSATTRLAHGDRSVRSVTAPQVDNTKPGTDYTITSGGAAPEPPPAAEEPPKEPKEKKCKKQGKGKGKDKGNAKGKKKCKKKGKGPKEPKPEPAGCAAYTPGEEGAEAETLSVTDANTEEAPLEITMEQKMGLGGPLVGGVPVPPDQASHAFKNLQVDASASEAGLYIRYEFPVYEDHDLYVNYPDGSEAAHVGGFNAVPEGPFDGTGAGGHSEHGAEQIDGLRTPDCGGYTVDFTNYLGGGGKYTVLVWLGEIQNDPAAPAKAVK